MKIKIEKRELCHSCRKIRPVMNDGSLGTSIEDWLDSAGYNSGNLESIAMMNAFAYKYLMNNGGCSSCINLFESLLKEGGLSDDWLNKFVNA